MKSRQSSMKKLQIPVSSIRVRGKGGVFEGGGCSPPATEIFRAKRS